MENIKILPYLMCRIEWVTFLTLTPGKCGRGDFLLPRVAG